MTEVLFSILAFLVAISVLIAIHEFGHFWVAKKLGVKVLRYSIGFGKPLWKKTAGADKTEYVVASLPLGGYVKMLDEREGTVSEDEKHRAFNRQSVGKRFAIVFAGPAFNFLFAILAYWLMFVIGVTGIKPVIGEIEPNTPAALAGLVSGQEIVTINDKPTPIWDVAIQTIIPALVDRQALEMEVKGVDGYSQNITLDLSDTNSDLEPGELFVALGLKPWRPLIKPVVGTVVADSPAQQAGLQTGDEILAIDNITIGEWGKLVEYVAARPDTELSLRIKRQDSEQLITLHTASTTVKGKTIGRMGIGPKEVGQYPDEMKILYRYSFLDSVTQALGQTWNNTLLTLKMIGKILVGDVSVKNLSGPINIAVYAGYSASAGLARFMDFLAIVSISLGVLNLLPIPILDGGHLMYYGVEIIRGKPVSEATMEIGQRIGILLLIMLMSVAFYNDIVRLLN
jgi:regulator of sigma E protease